MVGPISKPLPAAQNFELYRGQDFACITLAFGNLRPPRVPWLKHRWEGHVLKLVTEVLRPRAYTFRLDGVTEAEERDSVNLSCFPANDFRVDQVSFESVVP